MPGREQRIVANEKPVSFAPLDLGEALGALLKVKPQPKDKPKKKMPKTQKKPSD